MYKFIAAIVFSMTLTPAIAAADSFTPKTGTSELRELARVDPAKTLQLIRRIKDATEAGLVVS